MEFKNYDDTDYDAVCSFLIELNNHNTSHMNWNWARFEWMMEHPYFQKENRSRIGLWRDEGKIIGAAIYDLFFGEAFCAVLPRYQSLYKEVLSYATSELADETGISIAINQESQDDIQIAEENGFTITENKEVMLKIHMMMSDFSYTLTDGCFIKEFDPAEEPYQFQWILWQAFDHGNDEKEFRQKDKIVPQIRRHFNKKLSLAAADAEGTYIGYCCLWYNEETDYAYVEPVCIIPSWRGKGIGKALVYEALSRAKELGATSAWVISDMEFYKRLGFHEQSRHIFYTKSLQ